MISLNCLPIIQHVIRRTSASDVDDVVVATSNNSRDDIVARHARREEVKVYRGEETDVLGRVFESATVNEADLIVRITADNPLLSPEVLDVAIQLAREDQVDYVSNKIERTFPAGLDVEVFTYESFKRVNKEAKTPHEREHVTPYYRSSDSFTTSNVSSDQVFDERYMQNRTDLRFTLDTPDDFQLFEEVYANVDYDGLLDITDAVTYVDNTELGEHNMD